MYAVEYNITNCMRESDVIISQKLIIFGATEVHEVFFYSSNNIQKVFTISYNRCAWHGLAIGVKSE